MKALKLGLWMGLALTILSLLVTTAAASNPNNQPSITHKTYIPIVRNINNTVVTATRFINQSSYLIISLKIDNVEKFPSSPQGIPTGSYYQINLSAGVHTFYMVNGFWQDNGTRFEMYTSSGSFTQRAGYIEQVTFINPTICQLLSGFSNSGYWSGEYWINTIMYYAAFRFYSNCTYNFYDNGVFKSSVTYSLLTYNGNFIVTFRVSGGGYIGTLSETGGYFYMENGPPGWKTIQYTHSGH